MKKVAMIGVGKLGEPCATVMAQHYDVVGFDSVHVNASFPMKSSIQEAVQDRDIIFIAVPTPHDPRYGGETPSSHLPNTDFDYSIVTNTLNEINKYVSKDQLVVLISTVLPGTVRSRFINYITNARFIYNPYLIAMGTVADDFVNPEMIIIGTEDGSITGDASELIDFYAPLMQNNPRIEVGTWDEAEAIKIFYNTFISTKLALVNMIQDVAETSGNINVDVVTNALAKSTYRIMGPAYMKAGMGDGGACHPRDNIALRYLADKLNLGYDLFDSIMTAREVQAKRLAQKCLKYGNNVTIIGKAYKPNVNYTNGSSSLLVGHYVTELGGNVNYYDVHTGDTDLKTDTTDVYMIGYWDKYVTDLQLPNTAVVIDPWRQYNGTSKQTVHYGNTRQTREKQYRESLDHIDTIRLKSGIMIKHPKKIDGGGLYFRDDLIEVIKKTGKYVYNRGFEWCAGFGVLGYEMLGLGICNYIVFSDMFEPAIENCKQTAKNNNLSNYVTTYLTPNIADIPDSEKWDLVISNPPHSDITYEDFKADMLNKNSEMFDFILENTARLVIDPDFKIHGEFFNNISKHLTADADVYLIENHYYEKMEHMAKVNNLKLVGMYPMKDKSMQNGVILHFKPMT